MYIQPKLVSPMFVYQVEVESSVFVFIKCSDKKCVNPVKFMQNPYIIL